MKLHVVAVAFALSLGCATTPAVSTRARPAAPVPEPRAPGGPAMAPATAMSASPQLQDAGGSSTEAWEPRDEVRWRERWKNCLPGQALTEDQNRALDYFGTSELSVLRVSPKDTLNLRSASSPSATSLAQLDFQQAGMRWLGGACNVQGTLWLEIEWRSVRGWVNSFYARPTTPVRDETERVKSWLGTRRAKDFSLFLVHLRQAVTRQAELGETSAYVEADTTTIGTDVDRTRARVVLFVNNHYNDSIDGSQLLVTATREPSGWIIERVEWRDVCLRGAEELCI